MATHLWQSTLCAGLAALLTVLVKRAPARVRHGIWLIASVKFLVPFALIVAAGRGLAEWGLPASAPRVPLATAWLDLAVGSVGHGPAFTVPRLLLFALLAGWAAGAVGLMVWRWRRWREVSRLARAGVLLQDGRERAALERAPRHSRRPQRVESLLCAPTLEPGVLGVFRPKLLWPIGLSDRLSDTELEAILTHELCHVDRRDNLSGVVQMCVETVFWFHPVVWWLGARLLSERERACDEEVIRMGNDRPGYAEAILKVCRFYLRSPLACVSGVGGSDLTTRIDDIMRRPIANALTTSTRLLLVTVGLLVVSTPLLAGVLRANRADSPAPPSAFRPEGEQDSPQPSKPGNGVTVPKVVYEVKPTYTDEAMKARIQGNVMLSAVVLENGNVGDVQVVRSLDSTYGLDNEAVKAMKQWRFEPGTRNKKPVAVQVEVEMTFRLK